ncbi:MAG: hypothetical protein NVS2B7_22980 [Herpetosiphon sp.]
MVPEAAPAGHAAGQSGTDGGQCHGDFGGNTSIVAQQGDVGAEAFAGGFFGHSGEEKRGYGRATDAGSRSGGEGAIDGRFDLGGRQGDRRGWWDAQQEGGVAAKLAVGMPEGGDGGRIVSADAKRQAARRAVKGRQFVAAVADDEHTGGFQHLKGGGEIKDGFGTGTDDDDGGAAQFGEVGGDIPGLGGSAMDATYAASRKDGDPRKMSKGHGARNGCCTVPAMGDGCGKVATGQLVDAFTGGEAFKGGRVEADGGHAAVDTDGGRDRTSGPDRVLEVASGF